MQFTDEDIAIAIYSRRIRNEVRRRALDLVEADPGHGPKLPQDGKVLAALVRLLADRDPVNLPGEIGPKVRNLEAASERCIQAWAVSEAQMIRRSRDLEREEAIDPEALEAARKILRYRGW